MLIMIQKSIASVFCNICVMFSIGAFSVSNGQTTFCEELIRRGDISRQLVMSEGIVRAEKCRESLVFVKRYYSSELAMGSSIIGRFHHFEFTFTQWKDRLLLRIAQAEPQAISMAIGDEWFMRFRNGSEWFVAHGVGGEVSTRKKLLLIESCALVDVVAEPRSTGQSTIFFSLHCSQKPPQLEVKKFATQFVDGKTAVHVSCRPDDLFFDTEGIDLFSPLVFSSIPRSSKQYATGWNVRVSLD